MTNRDLIKYCVNEKPELLIKMFNRLYWWGWNDGARGHDLMDSLMSDWLDEKVNSDFWGVSILQEVSIL